MPSQIIFNCENGFKMCLIQISSFNNKHILHLWTLKNDSSKNYNYQIPLSQQNKQRKQTESNSLPKASCKTSNHFKKFKTFIHIEKWLISHFELSWYYFKVVLSMYKLVNLINCFFLNGKWKKIAFSIFLFHYVVFYFHFN